jgi:valyl-tRNA synthetase
MSDKDIHYDPKDIEDRYYKIWEDRGYFEVDGNSKIAQDGKNFSIMMPPPNVTGVLHIGHALTFTLQDIMVRYKRMDGFRTLWQPGLDHAGIATQNVVEKQLLEKGLKKEDIGREKFLSEIYSWKEYSGGAINHQMRKLGVSPAWSRSRFTMDDGLKSAVKKTFVKLYNRGLILRDNYMVNWCTHDGALSDIEVDYEDVDGKFYHIRYYLSDGSGEVVLATTRPETYFGDSAIMVHPDDKRYKDLVGKSVKLPIIDREIPIISDSYVDMDFGTGVVKVTPSHDINDYEVGKRHNLEFITCFDESGLLNSNCGEFEGLERLEARESIAKRLDELGYLVKVEEHKHQVGHCYRCKNIVEPYISKQWFVKKDIAKDTIKKVKDGHSKFFPSHWINSFDAWMNDLRDWCISRQLWWGHQIPVFYCSSCEYEFASEDDHPSECPKCKSRDLKQDPDVLDTWFSSGLWAFSTLGWGNGEFGRGTLWNDSDLEDFYPNTMLITGFDIMFFWVARMMFMGEEEMHRLPFKDIYLHALVRDEHGAKMSKSKGNVIDPLKMVEEFNADTLRFTLAALAVQGRDIKLSVDKLGQYRNFTNKLFNASRFLLMKQDRFEDLDSIEIKTDLGQYMLSRFNSAIRDVRANLDSYRFNDASMVVYRYFWGDFCDWGIELSKADKDSTGELGAIFKESLKLLHPFMPFISEHLYHKLSQTTLESSESIMVQSFPCSKESSLEIDKVFSHTIEAIVSIRRIKANLELGNREVDRVYIKVDSLVDMSRTLKYIEKLARVKVVELCSAKIESCASDIGENIECYLPLESIDLTPIIERLSLQKEKLQKELLKLNTMLSNKKFIQNAPKHVIQENQKALESVKARLDRVDSELDSFDY